MIIASSIDKLIDKAPLLSFLLAVAIFLIITAAKWKIYESCDEPGWAAIVPFYDAVVYFRVAWGTGWKCLLMLIPIVNLVVYIITTHKIVTRFGQDAGMTLGILIIPCIFLPILAFGNGIDSSQENFTAEKLSQEIFKEVESTENE